MICGQIHRYVNLAYWFLNSYFDIYKFITISGNSNYSLNLIYSWRDKDSTCHYFNKLHNIFNDPIVATKLKIAIMELSKIISKKQKFVGL